MKKKLVTLALIMMSGMGIAQLFELHLHGGGIIKFPSNMTLVEAQRENKVELTGSIIDTSIQFFSFDFDSKNFAFSMGGMETLKGEITEINQGEMLDVVVKTGIYSSKFLVYPHSENGTPTFLCVCSAENEDFFTGIYCEGREFELIKKE
jgi:hypothetical protein